MNRNQVLLCERAPLQQLELRCSSRNTRWPVVAEPGLEDWVPEAVEGLVPEAVAEAAQPDSAVVGEGEDLVQIPPWALATGNPSPPRLAFR